LPFFKREKILLQKLFQDKRENVIWPFFFLAGKKALLAGADPLHSGGAPKDPYTRPQARRQDLSSWSSA
jgi:hypothetical protein